MSMFINKRKRLKSGLFYPRGTFTEPEPPAIKPKKVEADKTEKKGEKP